MADDLEVDVDSIISRLLDGECVLKVELLEHSPLSRCDNEIILKLSVNY